MATYDARHVAHAAVATFDGVPIKQFVIPVLLWEMLVDKRKETSGYISCDVFVVWWVKPYDFSLSIALGFLCSPPVFNVAF